MHNEEPTIDQLVNSVTMPEPKPKENKFEVYQQEKKEVQEVFERDVET